MSVQRAHRAADRGLEIIQEILAATKATDPNAVSVAGPRAAGQVQLSPAVRRMLTRQANRMVHRETDPLIAQLQAQVPALHEALASERRSIQAANDMAAQAVSDISLKGIHGQTRHQLADELVSRQADIQASTPFLMSDARQEYQEQKGTLLQDIAKAQAEQQGAIGSTLNSLISTAKTQARGASKTAATDALATLEERADAGSGASAEVNAALAEARRLLTAHPDSVPRTDQQWANFLDYVEQGEGVSDPNAAAEAVKRIRAMVEANQTKFAQDVNMAAGPAVAETTLKSFYDLLPDILKNVQR